MKQNKKDVITATGMVIEALPNAFFRVKIDSEYENFLKQNKDTKEVFAHLSGKMRMHYIKVLIGDKVKLEISAYDTSKGRIAQRF